MKQKNLIILLAALVAVLAAAAALYNVLGGQIQADRLTTMPTEDEEESQQTGETEEKPHDQPQDFSAPDFTVVDRAGNAYRLSDFEGKPVVLNFWASWCGPCKSEMPAFEDAYKTYGGEIHFLLVNLTDGQQETVETASAYIDGQGYTFPVYYDTTTEAAYTYGVNAVPVTYFIDANGDLVAYGQGALDAGTLQRGIDMILPPE